MQALWITYISSAVAITFILGNDTPILYHQLNVGLPGQHGIVGHEDNGFTEGAGRLPKQREYPLAALGVQVAGGLIRQQNSGPGDQRPGYGHPLLLAAG